MQLARPRPIAPGPLAARVDAAETLRRRYVLVAGGANTLPDLTPTGTVFVIDLATGTQIATVTGAGIDP